MLYKRILVLTSILVVASSLILGGTTGKVTGTITDEATGLPLAGVNVILEGTIYGSAANVNGVFLISNVPAGTYNLNASMIGYSGITIQNIKVNADLTTRQDLALTSAVIEGETVVIQAERKLIQQDITASRTIQSGQDLLKMPVDNYEGALTTIAGAVFDDGEVHFRGGRATEIVYLLDNTALVDPLSGNNDTEISTFAIEETHTMTGGFSAEYGNAQSGVVNVITKDGGDQFSGKFRYTTSDYGLSSELSTVRIDEVPEDLNRLELSFSGPVPVLNNVFPGKLNYLVTGDFTDSQGRFVNQQSNHSIVLAKLTYKPVPQTTIRFNALVDNEYTRKFAGAGQNFSQDFANLWKKTVYEDRQFESYEGFDSWVDNGMVDTEDIGLNDGTGVIVGAGNGRIDFIDVNGNNKWDEGEPTEDINNNGKVDTEDLNHNNQLDAFNMLDHLSPIKTNSDQFGIFISHLLNERTFYEIHLTRYYTRQFINAKEIIMEDIDGDGRLDATDEWIITADYPEGQWIDLDGDGYLDRGDEDLNGNGILDEYGVDLYTDYNSNEYVDASEGGPAPRDYYLKMGQQDPQSTWIPWADIPYQGQKDTDGFYTYGAGTTWDRRSWYEDISYDYGLKFDINSQLTENHMVRAGIDAHVKDIFRYDGTDRYGYGEKFNVHPFQIAGYIQDKMEYGGMIMNIGVRYDFFNANWDKYPNNPRDPTWDYESEVLFTGNEDANSNGRLDAGEDSNNNGVLDQDWIAEKYQKVDSAGEPVYDGDGFPVYTVYPGEIKDPRRVPSQDFISPRFGISYPITVNDKMYFSYGRYFSAPLGTSLYRNLEFDLGGGFPVIGNPNLEPEKTTSYEAGIIHAFPSQSTLELKGFFKNITGLTNSKDVYFNQRDWYAFYINDDYGTVRGFELTFTQRPLTIGSLQFGGLMTYTFQIAKNKHSDTFDGYYGIWADDIPPTEETYTDWDQRHTLNFNLDIRTSERLGLLLGGWSTNVLYRYGSGTRWTPPKGQDRAALDNTELMPEKHTVDVRFERIISINKAQFDLFIDIRNLFDRKNIIGIADEEWYALFDGDEDGKPDYDPQGKYKDPTVYERGRLVRAGIQVSF